MGDMTTAITLLTVTVILLSVVIVALLVTLIVVLVKVNRAVNTVNAVGRNIASATEWLSPVKIFQEAAKAFRR